MIELTHILIFLGFIYAIKRLTGPLIVERVRK